MWGGGDIRFRNIDSQVFLLREKACREGKLESDVQRGKFILLLIHSVTDIFHTIIY